MLRSFLSILFISLISLGLFLHDAQAARFGGGRSFGISRSASSFSRSAPNPAPAFGQSYSRTQSGYNRPMAGMGRWFGPLAGLLTGGLLASLFMSNGFASGILSWVLVGGLILVLLNLFRQRQQPNMRYQSYQDGRHSFAQEAMSQFMRQGHSATNAHTRVSPLGFDESGFLRDAKVNYIRLQAAYDQKNLNDIREFTTPEVFAEIQMQLQERGAADNKTHVLSLDAELVNLENASQMLSGAEMQSHLASVRFTGMVQENPDQPAALVNEIWHFKKDVASPRWMVAGVQQS